MSKSVIGVRSSATLESFVLVYRPFDHCCAACLRNCSATLSIISHTGWTRILEELDLDLKTPFMCRIVFTSRVKMIRGISTHLKISISTIPVKHAWIATTEFWQWSAMLAWMTAIVSHWTLTFIASYFYSMTLTFDPPYIGASNTKRLSVFSYPYEG